MANQSGTSIWLANENIDQWTLLEHTSNVVVLVRNFSCNLDLKWEVSNQHCTIMHIIELFVYFIFLCCTCNISWIIYWNFETVSSCWVYIQTESLSSFTSSGACDSCLNFKQQVNLHELHRNMDILWKKYIIWMPENSVFPPKNIRKSPENHRFSPSRKKLKSSKNPWHHLSTLGPSIHLSTSYIVSKFEEDWPSGSRDITIFVPGLDLMKNLTFWNFRLVDTRTCRPLSDRPSAALCPCRVPRNPWKLPLVDTPHTDTLGSAVGCSLPV